jgi:hypothetical protein
MLLKRISSIVLISLLSIFGMAGCKQVDVEEDNNNTTIEEQIQELDVEALEQEYMVINETIEHVLTVVTTSEEIGIREALDLIEYVQKNRIEPTQILTEEYNNLLDELINLGIDYVMADGNEKLEIEEKIILVIEQLDIISTEIEKTIDNFYAL